MAVVTWGGWVSGGRGVGSGVLLAACWLSTRSLQAVSFSSERNERNEISYTQITLISVTAHKITDHTTHLVHQLLLALVLFPQRLRLLLIKVLLRVGGWVDGWVDGWVGRQGSVRFTRTTLQPHHTPTSQTLTLPPTPHQSTQPHAPAAAASRAPPSAAPPA